MVPGIIIDGFIAEEPARREAAAADFNLPLVTASAGAEDVQNILPARGIGDNHVVIGAARTVLFAFTLDLHPSNAGVFLVRAVKASRSGNFDVVIVAIKAESLSPLAAISNFGTVHKFTVIPITAGVADIAVVEEPDSDSGCAVDFRETLEWEEAETQCHQCENRQNRPVFSHFYKSPFVIDGSFRNTVSRKSQVIFIMACSAFEVK